MGTSEAYEHGTWRDRRNATRFPIDDAATYRILGGTSHHRISKASRLSGAARCVNISSGGVLLTTDHQLPVGGRIEVLVNWPARLNGVVSLRLVVRGVVVRSEVGYAAVQIVGYEFRTWRAMHA